jgi:hypothetical protein
MCFEVKGQISKIALLVPHIFQNQKGTESVL